MNEICLASPLPALDAPRIRHAMDKSLLLDHRNLGLALAIFSTLISFDKLDIPVKKSIKLNGTYRKSEKIFEEF